MIENDPYNRRGKSKILEDLVDAGCHVIFMGENFVKVVFDFETINVEIGKLKILTLKQLNYSAVQLENTGAANPIKRITVGKSKGDKANKKLLRAQRGW